MESTDEPAPVLKVETEVGPETEAKAQESDSKITSGEDPEGHDRSVSRLGENDVFLEVQAIMVCQDGRRFQIEQSGVLAEALNPRFAAEALARIEDTAEVLGQNLRIKFLSSLAPENLFDINRDSESDADDINEI